LSEEQAKETVKKYKELLEQNGAQNIYEEFWGLRKLAYPIQKKLLVFIIYYSMKVIIKN